MRMWHATWNEMMMRKTILMLLALSSVISFNESNAGTLKDEYELKERCGKQAQTWFRNEYVDSSSDYVNHFNSKMNTCLVLVTTFHGRDKNEKGSKPSWSTALMDIN